MERDAEQAPFTAGDHPIRDVQEDGLGRVGVPPGGCLDLPLRDPEQLDGAICLAGVLGQLGGVEEEKA